MPDQVYTHGFIFFLIILGICTVPISLVGMCDKRIYDIESLISVLLVSPLKLLLFLYCLAFPTMLVISLYCSNTEKGRFIQLKYDIDEYRSSSEYKSRQGGYKEVSADKKSFFQTQTYRDYCKLVTDYPDSKYNQLISDDLKSFDKSTHEEFVSPSDLINTIVSTFPHQKAFPRKVGMIWNGTGQPQCLKGMKSCIAAVLKDSMASFNPDIVIMTQLTNTDFPVISFTYEARSGIAYEAFSTGLSGGNPYSSRTTINIDDIKLSWRLRVTPTQWSHEGRIVPLSPPSTPTWEGAKNMQTVLEDIVIDHVGAEFRRNIGLTQ